MANTNDPALQSNQLALSVDFPQDEEDRIEVITSAYKRTVDAMNTKIGGLFSLQEVANFERWFKVDNPQETRNGYRRTYKFGKIAPSGVLSFTHELRSIKEVTDYRAIVFTSANDWRKVPYADVTLVNNQISMNITETKIIITNGSTAPSIIRGIAVLEILKQG